MMHQQLNREKQSNMQSLTEKDKILKDIRNYRDKQKDLKR